MKKYRNRNLLLLCTTLLIAMPFLVLASGDIEWGRYGFEMTDRSGQGITDSDWSVLQPDDGASTSPVITTTDGSTLAARMPSNGNLARADYEKVYRVASELYGIGLDFRTDNLQYPPECDGKDLDSCLITYADFNGGELYRRFCTLYESEALNASGACPPAVGDSLAEPRDIRNQLIRARDMFGFLAANAPADLILDAGSARDLGRSGVLSATREIANVHLIFGNEFLSDALDYRFSGNDLRAERILQQEIDLLLDSKRQFELAIEVLSHAFNADYGGADGIHAADFFTPREYDLFVIVSERLIVTLGELALRYRQLGEEQQALDLFAEAYSEQYIHALSIAHSAGEDATFLQNGGWRLMNNMEQLQAQARSIYEGVNPFGFTSEYVPLQSYERLRETTENDYLRDASDDENYAETAQRKFDQNKDALLSELQSLRTTYNTRLRDICGPQEDDYTTRCNGEGGLMQQNGIETHGALLRIAHIEQQLANNLADIEIEQQRAESVINIINANAERINAIELARGMTQAYRTTETIMKTQEMKVRVGIEDRLTVQANMNPMGCAAGGCGATYTRSFYAGVEWGWTTAETSQTTFDPTQLQLGELSGLQALQQAMSQVAIEGTNKEAYVQRKFLERAELLIQLDIAINEWNRHLAVHNQLVADYEHWLNLRELARNDLADSYLTNPAYRILRDSATFEAARSHAIAARYAYLTAKALEYDLLSPIPITNEIFKARTADDIDNFLLDLRQYELATEQQLARRSYSISVAEHLLGLTGDNITPEQRVAAFQQFIQDNVVTENGRPVAVEFSFTTSLLDSQIFTPNLWNNRIAGVGEPLPDSQGIHMDLITRQFGDIGSPEIQLTHGGHVTYRNAAGELVSYSPDNARLPGYQVPNPLQSVDRTATIQAGVNGNGRGRASGELSNLSVAASNWTLRIDLNTPTNRNLDISQIEDIEILIDTTGISL
jgi:hypothetical protein